MVDSRILCRMRAVRGDSDSLAGKYRWAGRREDRQTADVRWAVFPEARGFRRLRRPGSSRHGADALGGSGSAHRAGWFRGSYVVSLRREAVFSKARGGRPPLAGRGSALRFREGRGLCRRGVKTMTTGWEISLSCNADFIFIARRAIPQPSGQRPVKPENLRPLCGRQT